MLDSVISLRRQNRPHCDASKNQFSPPLLVFTKKTVALVLCYIFLFCFKSQIKHCILVLKRNSLEHKYDGFVYKNVL